MIGMFVATLPYRMELNPRWSFDELVSHVRDKSLSILEHSHYSLQNILADVQLNQSNVLFLQTMFDFTNMPSNMNQLSLNGANCEQMPLRKSSEVAIFDFMARFLYNPTVKDEELSCRLVCSRDLFDLVTVVTIARRFQHFVVQLLSSNIDAAGINHFTTSINKFAVILPEEAEERQKTVFHRLPSVINEGICVFNCF
jgi:non-ribosomal peptide synthetase component F